MEKQITKAGIISEINRAIAVVSLKEPEIKAVSESKKSEMYGAGIFLLPLLVNVIFMMLFSPIFMFDYLLYYILIGIGSFVGMLFVAKLLADQLFKTKLDVKALFRVLSYASLITWPAVLPILFSMLNLYGMSRILAITAYLVLWIFVVLFIYLFKVLKMKQNDAIVVAIASVISYYLILSLLSRILMGGFYGMGMGF